MNVQSEREKSIFGQAVEIDSHTELVAFLEKQCGDDAQLRKEIEALLRAHAKARPILDSPILTGELAYLEENASGTVIGPYKLLEPIGEGGMGTVWMAQQSEPIKRRVALKLIKAGMDTRQVIARFEAERQALAVMDHPSIAKVFDAGTTETGRPYFVMELVKGTPITKFCDTHQLDPRQRLRLFQQVCHAVQHAHQKGIIHRDLKPSNVMVAMHDDRPVSKVIDFGVAKATDEQLTEKTFSTRFGQLVGTLEYMSPEQAQLNQVDVDTRSDIYSLGVILYELLTGEPPFDKQRIKNAAFDETLKMIREEEPTKPSTKISSLANLPEIASMRHTQPQRLFGIVRGELDWIVMKALEKDRVRRYETASSFAADVAHYLNDEPVLACPPSARYRFGKFARRNKLVFAATGAVLGALFIGMVGTTWQAMIANNARHTAEAEARRATAAEQLVQDNADDLRVARNRAQANFTLAQNAVDQMLTRLGEDGLKHVPHAEQIRRELLQDALRLFEGLRVEQGDDPDLRLQTGRAHRRVGQINATLGDADAAKVAYQQSVKVLEVLSAQFPASAEYQRELALSLKDLGAAEVGDQRQRVLETSLLLTKNLVSRFPDQADYRIDQASVHLALAVASDRTGHDATAGAHYQYALNLLEELQETNFKQVAPLLVDTYHGYGSNCEGDRTAEEHWYRRAIDVAQRLIDQCPGDRSALAQQARVRLDLTSIYRRTNRNPAGLAEAERGIASFEQLVDDFPDVPEYKCSLAWGYLMYSKCFPDDENADSAMLNAVSAYREVYEQYPELPWNKVQYVLTLGELALLYLETNRYEKSVETYRQWQSVREEIFNKYPHEVRFLRECSWESYRCGLALHRLGMLNEAEQYYSSEVKRLQRVIRENGLATDMLNCKLLDCYSGLADVYLDRGDVDAALKSLDSAVEVSRAIFVAGGGVGAFGIKLRFRAAELNHSHGRSDVAAAHLRETISEIAALLSTTKGDARLGEPKTGSASDKRLRSVAKQPLLNQFVSSELFQLLSMPERDDWRRLWQEVRETVLANLTRAIEAEPENVDLYWARADFYLQQRNWQGVIEDCTTMIKLDPQHRIYWRRGWVRLEISDFDGAISDYAEAIRINPEHWAAYLRRGWACYHKQQFELALKDANYVLEKRPYAANYLLGCTHLAQGDHEQAINDFQNSIEINQESCWVYYRKGWAQLRGGNIEQASVTLDRAVEIAVSKNDIVTSSVLPHLRHWTANRPAVDWPGVFWSYFSRANLHLEQGNRDQALADFCEAKKAFDEESLALDPALDVWKALAIAITNGHLGNHQQARQQYAIAGELIERWPIDKNQDLRRLRDEAQSLLESFPIVEKNKTND